MKYLILFFLFLSFLNADWKIQREKLQYIYKIGEFRIFYDLKGHNKLPIKNQKDLNDNKVPDYIENIALRLHTSSVIFQNEFGFISPLKTPRYRNKVQYIDIHILNMKSKGSGGDGIHSFKYKILPNESSKSLAIKLSTNLRDKTLTPIHELFHLYQNGYSMFKNRWYTEGTARWSEYVLKKGTGSRKKLPSSIKELEQILSQTYDTKYMWRRLAYILDTTNGEFNYPQNIEISIIGYPMIIEDTKVYGANFIKSLLRNMTEMNTVASKSYGLSNYTWDESIQRSIKNNKYILIGLKTTILQEYKKSNKEIDQFLNVIDAYLKMETSNE